MARLSVNINKIATLRNARGGNVPNVIKAAIDCERFGADGITVHPRPDERHIRYKDVLELKEVVTTEFNIEGYPNEEFMSLVLKVAPTQVTLVPDPPGVLTSNSGWNTISHEVFLHTINSKLRDAGIRSSIFISTDPELIRHAVKCGADRVELYTEHYAKHYVHNREHAVEGYRAAAIEAHTNGLGVNAGHDLNLVNLEYFVKNVPYLEEVSIGHALISDALYLGLENAVRMYKVKATAV